MGPDRSLCIRSLCIRSLRLALARLRRCWSGGGGAQIAVVARCARRGRNRARLGRCLSGSGRCLGHLGRRRGSNRRARRLRRSRRRRLRGLGRGRLLGLLLALEPLSLSLAPDAVRLGVLDRGRVALDADPERDAEIEGFLVREPQLTGKLVDADLLGQFGGSVLSGIEGARREHQVRRCEYLSSHIGGAPADSRSRDRRCVPTVLPATCLLLGQQLCHETLPGLAIDRSLQSDRPALATLSYTSAVGGPIRAQPGTAARKSSADPETLARDDGDAYERCDAPAPATPDTCPDRRRHRLRPEVVARDEC